MVVIEFASHKSVQKRSQRARRHRTNRPEPRAPRNRKTSPRRHPSPAGIAAPIPQSSLLHGCRGRLLRRRLRRLQLGAQLLGKVLVLLVVLPPILRGGARGTVARCWQVRGSTVRHGWQFRPSAGGARPCCSQAGRTCHIVGSSTSSSPSAHSCSSNSSNSSSSCKGASSGHDAFLWHFT